MRKIPAGIHLSPPFPLAIFIIQSIGSGFSCLTSALTGSAERERERERVSRISVMSGQKLDARDYKFDLIGL